MVLVVKNLTSNAGDAWDKVSIPELGQSPGRPGHPLQYPCLENPMDRGAWWTAVHEVAKSQTLLKQLSTHLRRNESPWLYWLKYYYFVLLNCWLFFIFSLLWLNLLFRTWGRPRRLRFFHRQEAGGGHGYVWQWGWGWGWVGSLLFWDDPCSSLSFSCGLFQMDHQA